MLYSPNSVTSNLPNGQASHEPVTSIEGLANLGYFRRLSLKDIGVIRSLPIGNLPRGLPIQRDYDASDEGEGL